ncbi:unnamed protein product [Rotaria magnacalcarata]|uniref:RING-type domain-containing protein n=2 Tax=Rotaria magnacalcarata TaxID=392030 RepID=A0A814RJ75_9BILA|nr:unnamed protein product [Rotaria magnacalcarata]CAF1661338.1 unnamed protein product [Rotaria magnacalcarata]CAF3854649.1 unnamed protein product [Rotaria magnacalcarata]CAF3907367.1 unnamed protein product [Rotaria magnacalcarata]
MSRQNSNRSFLPPHHASSDNASRRFRPSSAQNDFSYSQYSSQRQMNHNNHYSGLPFNHATTASSSSAPYYHFENPSAASFARHPPWFDYEMEGHNSSIPRSSHQNNHTKRQRRISTAAAAAATAVPTTASNSQTYHHREPKRSRNDENQRVQHNHSLNHQYSSNNTNQRSRQSQPTNPTAHYVPYFARSTNYGSHNHSMQPPRHFHHQPSPVMTSNNRQSILSSHQRSGISFEPTSHRPPSFHRTSMTTHIHQRPSSSFLLTDLLHRVIDAQAASYYDNYVHYHPSFDMISYAWMSPSHEVFSLPTTFNIQFGEFFDSIIPDETPVVGLTDSELEKLPTIIHKKNSTNIKADDKCAICLSEYIVNEKLKRLRCKHYFHSECIDPWLKTSTRCPICRGEQTR